MLNGIPLDNNMMQMLFRFLELIWVRSFSSSTDCLKSSSHSPAVPSTIKCLWGGAEKCVRFVGISVMKDEE